MKSSIYQFLIGCFAAIGSFLFGYDLWVQILVHHHLSANIHPEV
jgi:hypothetical protein